MALDDEVKKLADGSLSVVDISIDPDKPYDRKTFVKGAKPFFKLQRYYSALKENHGDVGAQNDIAGILMPKNPALLTNRGSDKILTLADQEIAKAEVKLAHYVENNKVIDDLDEKQLRQFLAQIANPKDAYLFKSKDGKDKDYDRLVDIVARQGMADHGDHQGLVAVMAKLLQNDPLFNRCQNDQAYMQEALESYSSLIGHLFAEAFTKQVGDKRELDQDKMYDFIKKNLEMIKDEMKDNPETADKLWDDNLKRPYIHAASTYFKKEETAQKIANDKQAYEDEKAQNDRGIRT